MNVSEETKNANDRKCAVSVNVTKTNKKVTRKSVPLKSIAKKCPKSKNTKNSTQGSIKSDNDSSTEKTQNVQMIETTQQIWDSGKGLINIHIQGVVVPSLLDTGAGVSCIRLSVFEKLGLHEICQIRECLQTLSHAGGGTLKTIGIASFPITVGDNKVLQDFHVVQNLSHSCILGRDFLSLTRAEVSFATNTLTIQYENQLNSIQISIPQKTVLATVQEDVIIQGPAETIIPLTCKSSTNASYLAEPVQSLVSVHHLAGARCLVKVSNGKGMFQLCNPTTVPKTLKKGTIVAVLTPVSNNDVFEFTDTNNDKQTINIDSVSDTDSINLAKDIGVTLNESQLSETEKQKLMHLIGSYRSVFAKDISELTGTNVYHHKIYTGDAPPIRRPPYRSSPQMQKVIDKEMEIMEKNGVIEPSTSDWASPVVLVRKKNNTWRFAVDYTFLNKVKYGSNSLVYIDDIIVFSSSFEEHLSHLSSVFTRLIDANLKLQPTKCRFALPKVGYLGHQISSQGISPDPEKVETVKYFPVPKNKKELQSYLGLINYYRRFISGFSHIAGPLNKLLKNDQSFTWTDSCQSAFSTLKDKLLSAPILAYPNFSKEFIIYTDASDHAIGYILGQLDNNNKEVVIAYGGRSLSTCERNYGISDKEGLALVSGIKHFESYLRTSKFTVYTDHSALKGLQTLSKQTGRRQRWSDYLQGFQFDIIHKPGRVHWNADGLSRRPYPESPEVPEPEPNLIPLVSALDSHTTPNKNEKLVEYSLSYINTVEVSTIKKTEANTVLTIYQGSEAVYNNIAPLDLLQDALQLPSAKVRDLQMNDPEIGPIVRYLEEKLVPDDEKLAREIRRTSPDYEIIAGVLHYKYAPQGKGPRTQRIIRQLMVPRVLHDDLLRSYHDSTLGCHQGITRTYERMKLKYWWHTMSKDTRAYVESCEVCQQAKRNFNQERAPLQPLPVVDRFDRIHMDFLGPLPTTTKGHKYILLVVDSLTHWCECFPLASTDAATVARILFDEIICRWGAPRSILTDRGQQFLSVLIKELCKLFQIVKINTSAYHPQTNSACERMNSFILQSLRALCNKNQTDWHEKLQSIMLAYRTTPASRSIKHTPFMLMYGQEYRLPIDVALSAPSDSPHSINDHLQ